MTFGKINSIDRLKAIEKNSKQNLIKIVDKFFLYAYNEYVNKYSNEANKRKFEPATWN